MDMSDGGSTGRYSFHYGFWQQLRIYTWGAGYIRALYKRKAQLNGVPRVCYGCLPEPGHRSKQWGWWKSTTHTHRITSTNGGHKAREKEKKKSTSPARFCCGSWFVWLLTCEGMREFFFCFAGDGMDGQTRCVRTDRFRRLIYLWWCAGKGWLASRLESSVVCLYTTGWTNCLSDCLLLPVSFYFPSVYIYTSTSSVCLRQLDNVSLYL